MKQQQQQQKKKKKKKKKKKRKKKKERTSLVPSVHFVDGLGPAEKGISLLEALDQRGVLLHRVLLAHALVGLPGIEPVCTFLLRQRNRE
jgi:hypothetical protein